MADLSVMGFLNEETQQETEYNLKDAQARSDISTINSKIPSNASSNNKLATISDVSAAYKPKGNATLATLPSLTVEHLNWVYNMTEDFITTSDFAEGAGKSVKAGNEVGIIDVSETSTPNYKYTVLGGFIDTSSLQPKTLDTPVEVGGVNRTTVESALSALANDKEDTILAASPLVKEHDEIMQQDVLRLTMDDTPTANSNNPVKSSGIKSALSSVNALIDGTVGWVGGNELPYPYFNKGNKTDAGINFIDNGNGEITVKAGTSTGNANYYIMGNGSTDYGNVSDLEGKMIVGNPTNYLTSGVDLRLWFYDTNKTYIGVVHVSESGTVISIPTDAVYYVLVIRVDSGLTVSEDILISPMIITPEQYAFNPSYRPYHESVEDWYWSENAKTGVHNFLNTEKFETGTKNGVTTTIRPDKGISLTGAPTLQSGTIPFRNYGTVLKAGTYKYKLNKNPKGTCVIGLNDSVSGLGNYKILTNLTTNLTEVSFTVTDEDLASKPYLFCELGVYYNVGTIDEVYYPQILLEEDTFAGFTPYAMTNRDLTNKVQGIIDAATNAADFAAFKAAIGNL